MADKPVLTTTAGNPVADNQNAMTAGPRGPVLMEDYQLLEKLAHQNRERIPERTVHAKGWGAFGRLTIAGEQDAPRLWRRSACGVEVAGVSAVGGGSYGHPALGTGVLLAFRGSAIPVGNSRVPQPAKPVDLNP